MLRKLAVFLLSLACVTASSVDAKIIGADDRLPAYSQSCSEMGFTIARMLVPGEGDEILLSTATAVSLDNGRPFFVSAAHALYRDGKLRAPLERVSVQLLLPDATGVCRFQPARIARFAVGAARPRKSFFGAARDLLLFEIEADELFSRQISPIHYRFNQQCTSRAVEVIGFASDFQNGQVAYKDQCHLRGKPEVSAYPDSSFQHHDCDTSTGSSGALLLCSTERGGILPVAVHTVGWGSSGQPFGDGVYNVGTPLNAQMLLLLHRVLLREGP